MECKLKSKEINFYSFKMRYKMINKAVTYRDFICAVKRNSKHAPLVVRKDRFLNSWRFWFSTQKAIWFYFTSDSLLDITLMKFLKSTENVIVEVSE